MTIKEVEQILGIPRATVRFYEKEGLIEPKRAENGYRDYSQTDVIRLKKILILRKIGLSVNDISDIFDGAKTMLEVLGENIVTLQKQIDELSGAKNLSCKMLKDKVEIASFDADMYWRIIDEEEKKGNSFIDITKDIIHMEKKIVTSYFSWTSVDGEVYDSFPKFILNVVIATVIVGCIVCLTRGSWNIKNFFSGITVIMSIILVEAVLSVPLYFLGKKYTWIRENRNKALIITGLIICVVLLIFKIF
ncbi:MAG: MerR family transcriptional regulator [Clostridiaceae bacterium]|nr:MerR family transcriptional regulator [Clostridiaceae bacterium]